jgi:hypothetical protein
MFLVILIRLHVPRDPIVASINNKRIDNTTFSEKVRVFKIECAECLLRDGCVGVIYDDKRDMVIVIFCKVFTDRLVVL